MRKMKSNMQHVLRESSQNKEIDSQRTAGSTMKFREQANGYEKEQVDLYIQDISQAYNTMYQKYTDMVQKRKPLDDKADAMARALMKAEMMAKQTVDAANQKALRILEDAKGKVALLSHTAEGEKAAIDTIVKIMEDTKATIDMIFLVVKDEATKASVVVNIMNDAKEKIDSVFKRNNQAQDDIEETVHIDAPVGSDCLQTP